MFERNDGEPWYGNFVDQRYALCWHRHWWCPHDTAAGGYYWNKYGEPEWPPTGLTSPSFTYNTAAMPRTGQPLPEGDHVFGIVSYDELINYDPAPREWHVKIDRTNPKVDVDGQVRDAEDLWFGAGEHTLDVHADDSNAHGGSGSGIKRVELHVDNQLADARDSTCSGETCPRVVDVPLTFNAAAYSDGPHRFIVRAIDAAGRRSDDVWSSKLDTAPPVVTQSGTLKDAEGRTLTDSDYSLVTNAEDGTSLAPQSGVQGITLSVNDYQADTADQQCEDESSCSLTHNFTYRNGDFGEGPQTITAVVADYAGNETQTTFTVNDSSDQTTCGGEVTSPSGQPCREVHTECTTRPTAQPAPSIPPALPLVDVVSADEALRTLRGTMPSVVARSVAPSDQPSLRPSLRREPSELLATGTIEASGLPTAAAGGMEVGRGSDAVCMKPTVTDINAAEPKVVDSDSVLFANTRPAVDTVMRPIVQGLESFLQLRNGNAPERFSWHVEMPAGATLQQLDENTVAVISDAEPFDDDAQTPTTLRPPTTATQPDRIPYAETQLADGDAAIDAALQATQNRTLAVIRAPWAKDRDGAGVPISLSADPADHTVTMTVSHRGSGSVYPVIADPTFTARWTEVTMETWNFHLNNAVRDKIDELARHVSRHNPHVVALQEVCSKSAKAIEKGLEQRTGRAWDATQHTALFRGGACGISGLITLAKRPASIMRSNPLERDALLEGHGNGTVRRCVPGRRIGTRVITPKCAQRVPVRLGGNDGADTTFFNAHSGAQRSSDRAIDQLSRYARCSPRRDTQCPSPIVPLNRIVLGDLERQPTDPVLYPLTRPEYWREADPRRNRDGTPNPAHTYRRSSMDPSRKLDYIFFGTRPTEWRYRSSRHAPWRDGLSDHRAFIATLRAPRYRY